MGKIKLKSSYKNAKRKQEEEGSEADDLAADKNAELSELEDDDDQSKGKKKSSGLVKKVRFKVAKKAPVIGADAKPAKSILKKRKPVKTAQKAKLEEIKKQLSSAVSATDKPTESSNPLYNIVPQARLTNAILKTVLTKSESDSSETKDKLNRMLAKTNLTKKDLLSGVKKLDKKSKLKLKKQFWHDRIDSIQTQLKANVDKAKREKTVIVGDMKPIIESLGVKVSNPAKTSVLFDTDSSAPSKREQHEKNREREKNKSVPKQSVRQKQSKSDLELFTQLQGFSEFTSNPLEILKKHFSTTK